MTGRPLPPDLDHLRAEARALLDGWRASDEPTERRVITNLPRPRLGQNVPVSLVDVRQVIARERGFANFSALKAAVVPWDLADPVTRFTIAALAPLEGRGHREGTLAEAEAIRSANAGAIGEDLVTACLLGDAAVVERCLAADPAAATTATGLHEWEPLVYLAFSRYLRLDPSRSAGFVQTAALLLDRGADPNGAFYSTTGELERVLYGVAGVARNPDLTRLLLERGADPNDGETPYHAPEGHDNEVLVLLLASKKLNDVSLTTILARKHDWHDRPGIALALAAGADPDRTSAWGRTAIEQAILRDNALPLVELLLDHGGARSEAAQTQAVEAAARAGRADLLHAFAKRGMAIPAEGAVGLFVACARGDRDRALALATRDPAALASVLAEGGAFLSELAAIGNVEGLRLLVELGVDPSVTVPEDGYLDLPGGTTALHAAAWCARHSTVALLASAEWRARHPIAIDARDARGETPLGRAVQAAVDSHWTNRRSDESVRALLEAGADPSAVSRFPCGYAPIDDVLRAHGRVAK